MSNSHSRRGSFFASAVLCFFSVCSYSASALDISSLKVFDDKNGGPAKSVFCIRAQAAFKKSCEKDVPFTETSCEHEKCQLEVQAISLAEFDEGLEAVDTGGFQKSKAGLEDLKATIAAEQNKVERGRLEALKENLQIVLQIKEDLPSQKVEQRVTGNSPVYKILDGIFSSIEQAKIAKEAARIAAETKQRQELEAREKEEQEQKRRDEENTPKDWECSARCVGTWSYYSEVSPTVIDNRKGDIDQIVRRNYYGVKRLGTNQLQNECLHATSDVARNWAKLRCGQVRGRPGSGYTYEFFKCDVELKDAVCK